jgi:hypothetical protein
LTAHCTEPTEEQVDGSYFYWNEKDGFRLVIITKGKTVTYPFPRARVFAHMSSLCEALKKEETGTGFSGF